MNEMIERVARAICASEGWCDWEEYIPQARAAITAMREPTDTMVDAVLAMPALLEERADTHRTWQTMIDAALS